MMICPCDKLGSIKMFMRSCVRAKSYIMSRWGLRELSLSLSGSERQAWTFFLYAEIKCPSPPIFSPIILMTERNNICPSVDAGVPLNKQDEDRSYIFSFYFCEILL